MNAESAISSSSDAERSAPALNRRGIREALQMISYGLYVLTTGRGREAHASTVNWLTQISFEPLLIMIAVEKTSHSRLLLQGGGVFAINFLSQDQTLLARRLAVPHRLNPHKLAGVACHAGVTGAPLLDEAIAFLEGEVRQALEPGGDHTLFVGEVVGGGVTRYVEPLTLLASRLRYK